MVVGNVDGSHLKGRNVAGIAMLVGIVATACAPSGSPAASSTSPAADAGESGSACSALDLRSPTGDPVDLTGTWATEFWTERAGTYYLQQIGNCLRWAGGFPLEAADPTFGPTGNWITVFRGVIGSDFTIVGDWTDVHRACTAPTVVVCYGGPARPGSGGTIELEISFSDAGAERLVYVDGTGELFNPLQESESQSWIRVIDDRAPVQTQP